MLCKDYKSCAKIHFWKRAFSAETFIYCRSEFGGHGQLRGGKGRGMPATGKLVAWQTKMVANLSLKKSGQTNGVVN